MPLWGFYRSVVGRGADTSVPARMESRQERNFWLLAVDRAGTSVGVGGLNNVEWRKYSGTKEVMVLRL